MKLKSGDKFGKLTVVNFDSKRKAWLCKCDCGSETYSRSWSLKTGRHKSCWCTQKEQRLERRLPNNESIKREMYNNYKQSSKRRKHNFELSEDQFFQLIMKECYYCGAESCKFNWNPKFLNREFRCNGIDRVNNSLGYFLDNCVPCCTICNMSKKGLTTQEWKTWLERVFRKQFNEQYLALER